MAEVTTVRIPITKRGRDGFCGYPDEGRPHIELRWNRGWLQTAYIITSRDSGKTLLAFTIGGDGGRWL